MRVSVMLPRTKSEKEIAQEEAIAAARAAGFTSQNDIETFVGVYRRESDRRASERLESSDETRDTGTSSDGGSRCSLVLHRYTFYFSLVLFVLLSLALLVTALRGEISPRRWVGLKAYVFAGALALDVLFILIYLVNRTCNGGGANDPNGTGEVVREVAGESDVELPVSTAVTSDGAEGLRTAVALVEEVKTPL